MQWKKKLVMELSAIILMAAIVSILATLQYQWTGEVSRAEQERLKGALATSVRNFSQEFSYDFERLCENFEIDPEATHSTLQDRVVRQNLNWTRTASRPGLVLGLHLWEIDDAHVWHFFSFDQKDGHFQEVVWPGQLESLRGLLRQRSGQLSAVPSVREAYYYPWTFFEDTPALIRPVFYSALKERASDLPVQPMGFLVVELSKEFLERQYLPELVSRHFGELERQSFGVAIRSADASYQAIYSSNPDWTATTSSPDATVNLFEAVAEEGRRRGHPPLQPSREAQQWQLVVQHQAGSLEAAVAGLRRRNFTISAGLLAILAGSMVFIFSVARRAERLTRLQMEFVAAVSHELCTPIAVINSAAENLADGIVENPQQMREYGGLIRNQGRRLEGLVDEVLLFAAGRSGRSGFELRPIEIAPIIAESLLASETMLHDAGFAVEREISADLPTVLADPAVVTKCIENLLSNALKYSGTNRWVAVRARVVSAVPRAEVQISVEDGGVGISAADLPNIFEPFYRVRSVRDGQIRGVGLGLYLVKRMMESMGGRVSVESEIGRGSFFILHFPASPEQRQGAAA